MKKFLQKFIAVSFLMLLFTNTAFAQMSSQQYFKKIGVNNIVGTKTSYELGSTSLPWAKVWTTVLNITGAFSTDSYIDITEMTAPANPSANVGRMYVADDGGTTTLYFKDSAGTATNLLIGGTTFLSLTDTPVGYTNAYALYRVNSATDAVEESPVIISGYDLIDYEAVNDGNPEFRIGATDAEELHIQSVYDSGAQTLDYVEFITDVASGTADKGKYIFDVDGVNILEIVDGGLTVTGTTTATSFTIGANVLDTNEFAFLDGQNQAVASGSTPSFTGLASTGDFTTTGGAYDHDVVDNTASAWSVDAVGKSGILEIDSTDTAEGIKMSGYLNIGVSTAISSIIDDDTMGTASATALSTSESIVTYIATQIATVDSFLELSDTPAGYTTDGAIYIANNTSSQVDESTVILTEAANTFNITKGTATFDVAAGADLNVDTDLTVNTTAVTLNQSLQTTNAVTFDDITVSTPVNIYGLSHDSFTDYVANEHIDWTSAGATNFSSSGTVTASSFIIGANTLDTNEWAFLDGQNQAIATGSTPSFTGITLTGDVTTTGGAYDWDVIDNNASAISWDSAGNAGIFEIVSSDDSEGVKTSGSATIAEETIFTPSGDQTRADDSTIDCTNTITRVVGDGDAVILDVAPSVADGIADGQVCTMQGTSDTNTVQVADNTNIQLAGGVDFNMGKGDTLTAVWDSGDSDWYEVSRSDN